MGLQHRQREKGSVHPPALEKCDEWSGMTETSIDRRRGPALVAALAVIPAAAAVVATPSSFAPAAATYGALVGLALACAAWMLTRHHASVEGGPAEDSTASLPLALVTLMPSAVLGASALLSENPRVSLLGLAGQHNGWLMWVIAWAFFTLFLFAPGTGATRSLPPLIAVFGGVSGLVALLQRARILESSALFSAEPAGVFESSVALGQVCVLAVFCAAAWARDPKTSPAGRVLAVTSGLASAVGLLTASASAAIAGLAVALTLYAVTRAVTRTHPVRAFVTGSLSFAALSFVTTITLATIPATTGVFAAADRILNNRPTLWKSAWEQFLQYVWLGAGPEQYSAWASWDVTRVGALRVQAAFDPHSTLMSVLTAGGIAALVALLAALAAVAARLLSSSDESLPEGQLILLAGTAGWAFSTSAAWSDPLSAFFAAAILGSVLGVRSRTASDAPPGRAMRAAAAAMVAAMGLCAVAGLVFTARPMLAEMDWAQVRDGIVEYYEPEPAPDPTFALTRAYGVPPGGQLDILVPHSDDASWHVDVAFSLAEARFLAAAGDLDDEEWEDITAMLDAGRTADPASSLWDFVGYLVASESGREEQALTLARRAVSMGLPPRASEMLEDRSPEAFE